MGFGVEVKRVSRSLRWIRQYLSDALLASCIVTAVIGTLISFTYLTIHTAMEPVTALPWAVVLGQVIALTRLAVATTTNPLSYHYLSAYIYSPFQFRPMHPSDAGTEGPVFATEVDHPADVLEVLDGWKLARTITVHDPMADPSPVFDLFHSRSGVVLAAVSHATGSLTLMTQLADGRILHTAALLVPPHPSIIVNTIADSPQKMAEAHTKLLALLTTLDITPIQTGVRVFADVIAAEHAAYSDLGALLGSVLNIDRRVSPNLSYGVDIDDLLEQTLL
ncbi:MAG: hypothetical protein HKN03_07060 [Acidimicrobiales bacterium]|nr:hypothetical protein [Acidimicrobiales bacterium]